jgi:hypothetical protein
MENYNIYVPKTFGNTFDHLLRKLSKEHVALKNPENLLKIPKYLFSTSTTPNVIISEIMTRETENNRIILIETNDYKSIKDAEISLLSNWYCRHLYHDYYTWQLSDNAASLIEVDELTIKDIQQWNSLYTDVNQLQKWELREWYSIFYYNALKEQINTGEELPDSIKFTWEDCVNDFTTVLLKIHDYCDLTLTNKQDLQTNYALFIKEKSDLLDIIIESTMNKEMFEWSELTWLEESIIQSRFLELGYLIKCEGLNEFPENSLELYNLLDEFWAI